MIIDLSVPINEQTPVYPGDPSTTIKPGGVIDPDGYADHRISINTHVGTHIDAPMHMVAGGKHLGDIPIEQFVGRGRLVEVHGTFDIETCKKADILPGDIVLFKTDATKRYHDPDYFERYPVMTKDVAEFLVQQKVNLVGLDCCSPDGPGDRTMHAILLEGGVLIIENLTNLDALKEKEFTVYALPVKLALDGAPARVIAEVK